MSERRVLLDLLEGLPAVSPWGIEVQKHHRGVGRLPAVPAKQLQARIAGRGPAEIGIHASRPSGVFQGVEVLVAVLAHEDNRPVRDHAGLPWARVK